MGLFAQTSDPASPSRTSRKKTHFQAAGWKQNNQIMHHVRGERQQTPGEHIFLHDERQTWLMEPWNVSYMHVTGQTEGNSDATNTARGNTTSNYADLCLVSNYTSITAKHRKTACFRERADWGARLRPRIRQRRIISNYTSSKAAQEWK